MSTSGTFDFNPSLGELVMYSYMNIGIRPTAIMHEHMDSARMATNMMLSRWSNQGVNLWAVELVEEPLAEGVSTYDVDPSTVMILDAYVVTDGIDRVIMPISRSQYAAYPNKATVGFPTVYWFDRTVAPEITLWPVPDGSTVTMLKYYRVRRIEDAGLANGQQVEVPYLWLEAFSDGLTYRLARIWKPELAVALKAQADESYTIAANQNVEDVQMFISPSVSGYWRT